MSNTTINRTQSPGATIDTEEVVVSGQTVERVREEITGTTGTAIAQPLAYDELAGSIAYGLQERIVGRLAQSYCDQSILLLVRTVSDLHESATHIPIKVPRVRRMKFTNGAGSSPIVIGGSNVSMVPGSDPVGILLTAGQSTGWIPISDSVNVYGAADASIGNFTIMLLRE